MLDCGRMKDTDCLFCKIIAGEVPSYKIYEDEYTYAFLDIKPVNPGHTLVIPKTHYVNVFDAPKEIWEKVMGAAHTVANAMHVGMPVADINITTNNGAHSGQVVFHSHVHVMPRYENDGHELWHGKPYQEGQAQEVAIKIKTAL